MRFYLMSCDANNDIGCYYAAWGYSDGTGVETDSSREFELLLKSCDIGGSSPCLYAGKFFMSGDGVETNETRATELFVKACETGEISACSAAGLNYGDGIGVPVNKVPALELYMLGCDANDALSCMSAAGLSQPVRVFRRTSNAGSNCLSNPASLESWMLVSSRVSFICSGKVLRLIWTTPKSFSIRPARTATNRAAEKALAMAKVGAKRFHKFSKSVASVLDTSFGDSFAPVSTCCQSCMLIGLTATAAQYSTPAGYARSFGPSF